MIHVFEWKSAPILTSELFEGAFTPSAGLSDETCHVNLTMTTDALVDIVVWASFPNSYQLTIAKDAIVLLKKNGFYNSYFTLRAGQIEGGLTIILEIMEN